MTDTDWQHSEYNDLYLPAGTTWYIPESMLEHEGFRARMYPVIMGNVSSVDGWIRNALGMTHHDDSETQRTRDDIFRSIYELRIQHDFEFWGVKCARIQNKLGDIVPFILNRPQRLILEYFERARVEKRMCRVNILKHRQFGATTECYGRILWVQLHVKKNWDCIITGHQKDLPKRVLGLCEKVRERLPEWALDPEVDLVKYANTENTREWLKRGGTVTVATVENPNAPSGITPKLAHCTEIGKWPSSRVHSAEDTVQNIDAMLVRAPDTIGIREGSAKANVGVYWKNECLASQRGKTGYEFCFIGWTDDPAIQMEMSEQDMPAFIESWRSQEGYISPDYEHFLWMQGATVEGIAAYRELRGLQNSHSALMEEYPTTPEEAFQAQQSRVFLPEIVTKMRDFVSEPIAVGDLIGASTEGPAALENLKFVPNPNGPLRIWRMPGEDLEIEPGHKVLDRYCAGGDPAGGLSKTASFNTLYVLDRGPMIHGRLPRTAALYRERIDSDLAAWKMAQVAYWYESALLNVERNYLRQDRVDEERGAEINFATTVLNRIFEVYGNLYYEERHDDLRDPLTWRLGWLSTEDSKAILVEAMNKALRDRRYIERAGIVLDEADTYIIHPSGHIKNQKGAYSDALEACMLAIWLSFEHMAPARLVEIKPRARTHRVRGHIADIA